MLLFTHNLT